MSDPADFGAAGPSAGRAGPDDQGAAGPADQGAAGPADQGAAEPKLKKLIMPCWTGAFQLDYPSECHDMVCPSGRQFSIVQHGDVVHVTPPPKWSADRDYLEHRFHQDPYKQAAQDFAETYLVLPGPDDPPVPPLPKFGEPKARYESFAVGEHWSMPGKSCSGQGELELVDDELDLVDLPKSISRDELDQALSKPELEGESDPKRARVEKDQESQDSLAVGADTHPAASQPSLSQDTFAEFGDSQDAQAIVDNFDERDSQAVPAESQVFD